MNNIRTDILSLSGLKDGWNFGEGTAITEHSILMAIAIIDDIPLVYKFIEAYPLNNGSISLRIGLDEVNVIGLMIESESQVQAYYDNNINIVDIGIIQFCDIKKFIKDESKKTLKKSKN